MLMRIALLARMLQSVWPVTTASFIMTAALVDALVDSMGKNKWAYLVPYYEVPVKVRNLLSYLIMLSK